MLNWMTGEGAEGLSANNIVVVVVIVHESCTSVRRLNMSCVAHSN